MNQASEATMNLLARARRLKALGILGMNCRNTECILDRNPRANFPLVDDKQRMHELCRSIGVLTPNLYGMVPSHSTLRQLPRLVAGRDSFVIKPNCGAGGRGVMVLAEREGDVFLRQNGQRLSSSDLIQHVSGIISGLFSLGGRPDKALLQQRVIHHAEFDRISYQGTADARIVVYRDLPLMAMLRLPTKLSDGRANLHQGAIGAGVDLATGRTIHAVLRNRAILQHPDTGISVIGFQVPFWPQILDIASRVSRATGLGYVGVDLVIDREQGPMVLEANARPGLAIQIANRSGLIPRLQMIDRQLA
jgi:alpha-L-glutamate ligase-like protein